MKLSYLLSRVEKNRYLLYFHDSFLKSSVNISLKISIFFNPALVLCLGVLAFLGAEEE